MKAILGTMTFGEQVFGGDAAAMLSFFSREGGREVDTAYVYNEGTCERIIGEALKETSASFSLATKVNPRISGKLDYEAVMRQLPESLDRMGVDSVDILYLHFPIRIPLSRSRFGPARNSISEGYSKSSA